MGKTMDKAGIIFGEHKAITLKEFGSAHERQVSDIVRGNIGPLALGEMNWHAVREKQKIALANEAMAAAHVKIGVIDGDLIWRAKADKFTGKKEYDAILFKHYSARVDEQEEFAASLGRDTDDRAAPELSDEEVLAMRKGDSLAALNRVATGGHDASSDAGEKEAPAKGLDWQPLSLGQLSRADTEKALAVAAEGAWLVRISTKEGAVASYRKAKEFHHQILGKTVPSSLGLEPGHVIGSTTDFRALLAFADDMEALQARPGYFKQLSETEAKEKLIDQPAGTWLIRGSSKGGVTWSYRRRDDKIPVRHVRLINQEEYDKFIKATGGRAARQITE